MILQSSVKFVWYKITNPIIFAVVKVKAGTPAGFASGVVLAPDRKRRPSLKILNSN
jgi:hypothetical protein